MATEYTISQLAKAADTPTSTLRYYERIGLLQPENRSQGNYRLYGEASLGKLKFIRAAQAIGFTLDDVRRLLGESDSVPCCGEVKQLIDKRLAEIDHRLKDLRHVQRILKAAQKECLESSPRSRCQVIDKLREQGK